MDYFIIWNYIIIMTLNECMCCSDIEWINTNMNEQQQQAVRKILNKTAHPAPYIIFGPPGTGKTATLVEVICQVISLLDLTHLTK